jgi:type I site-specific restriction endonuclease
MPGERLSETEICDHLITPALQRAGWLLKRMRREYLFTDGQMATRLQGWGCCCPWSASARCARLAD